MFLLIAEGDGLFTKFDRIWIWNEGEDISLLLGGLRVKANQSLTLEG